MKKEELLSCQFSSWYPRFMKNTIKSCIIPLPSNFVDYLQFDGSLVLPKGVKLGQITPEKEWEESEWENSSEENAQPEFTELVNKISVAIDELGGNVFPKMGWSAPRDASWINNNTLKCSLVGEIFLLLKSSDFVQHDLCSIFKLCEEPIENHSHELVLRKWANLSPGMEFRCFIRDHQLIGISQREDRQYYDFVEADKETLAEEIREFVTQKILEKFPSDSYTVDLYKKRNILVCVFKPRHGNAEVLLKMICWLGAQHERENVEENQQGQYWIIDFNPFAECTDSLLFTWQELKEGRLHDCDSSVDLIQGGCIIGQFRYTDKTTTLQPSDYLSYRMPVDFVDLSTGSDATKLIDFMRMIEQPVLRPSSELPVLLAQNFYHKLYNRIREMPKMQDGNSSESDDEEWRLPDR